MAPGELAIRTAGADDFGEVLALWQRSRSRAAAMRDTPEATRAPAQCSPDALLLAQLDGTVVGALIAVWDGWRGGMYRLAVVDDLRRQGIARRLVEAGHERLWAKGARRITALVGSDEQEASAFWEALGYECDANVARFVRNL